LGKKVFLHLQTQITGFFGGLAFFLSQGYVPPVLGIVAGADTAFPEDIFPE
jgi:hypothetical protein